MRIKIEIQRNQITEPLFDNLDRCGLNIVENHADIFVKLAQEITPQDLDSGKTFVALEKNDGAHIFRRAVLKHPAVIRYIKQYRYTDYDLNNLPCIQKRAFTRFLTGDGLAPPTIPITKEDYGKIALGWNFLHYQRMTRLLNLPVDGLRQRTIDVFFAGTVQYGDANHKSGRLISLHRSNCMGVLRSLKGLKVVAIEGKPLTLREYLHLLVDSKVVVSPWGWGEACYRDYEAILAGCVLIKPDTSFVSSRCNIFQQPGNVWVRPDFADLTDRITDALRSFDEFREARWERRAYFIKGSQQIVSIIKKVLDF